VTNPKGVLEFLEGKEKMKKCECKCKDNMLTKDDFCAKLEDVFDIYPEYYNNKYPEDRLDFYKENAVREFIELFRRKINT
jgi:hypothetical protein